MGKFGPISGETISIEDLIRMENAREPGGAYQRVNLSYLKETDPTVDPLCTFAWMDCHDRVWALRKEE